jgi:hypothetical protein
MRKTPGRAGKTSVPTTKEDVMSTDPSEHPAKPEQPEDESFAEGEASPETYPEDEHVGRFSEGEETSPDSAEKEHRGRFSEGEEELGEDDPEKHAEGRFSEGVDHEPPEPTP